MEPLEPLFVFCRGARAVPLFCCADTVFQYYDYGDYGDLDTAMQ
ncbi:MAG: hypothetical protein SNJ60_02935 [Pseudanabaenaceae cyanobacterium]